MPEISIIIPVYNRPLLVKEAIDSVMAQTYTDFELIVVDDGSTDTTADVIQKYIETYSNISVHLRYIYQSGLGVSAARNNGIDAANGKLTTFLDSDDLWQPNKLKRQMEFFASHPEAKICYTDEIWIRHNKRVNPCKVHQKYSGRIFEHCLPCCIISPSSVIIKKEVLEEVGLFDESLPACEDYDLWLRIAGRFKVDILPEQLIIKRNGYPEQLSRKYWGMDRFRVQAMEKHINSPYLNENEHRLLLEQLVKKYSILANGSHKRGKQAETALYRRKVEKYRHA
ncbi:MAG: glycosyltransferase family 2 protein [Nitrospinota bacterium]